MSAAQFQTTQLPNYIILILYIITGSLGNLGAIDILAPQWIYLGENQSNANMRFERTIVKKNLSFHHFESFILSLL